MKETKFISIIFALGLAFSLVMTGCSNDDDDNTSQDPAEIALESAAFNILRELCQLPTDGDADNAEEGLHDGVEYLPDNWKNRKFEPVQGAVKKDGDAKVRYKACGSLDEAREFMSSMVGESVSETSTWPIEGLGTLTYTELATDTEENPQQYAKIDVAVSLIPNLTQLNFMSASYMEANAATFDTDSGAENSYNGEPYYRAGDIIRRTKDGTIWMCVRPSGGPAHKGYSYFVCLDSYGNKTRTIIGSKTNKVTDSTGKKVTWTYAKGLMDFKIAKATAHTFGILASETAGGQSKNIYNILDTTNSIIEPGKRARNVHNWLVQNSYDLRNLWAPLMDLTEDDKNSVARGDECIYLIAYGSPQTDKVRKGQTPITLVQPYLRGQIVGRDSGSASEANTFQEQIVTRYTSGGDKIDYKQGQYFSATDYHDTDYMEWISSYKKLVTTPYDFTELLTTKDPGKSLKYKSTNAYPGKNVGADVFYEHVFFSPQIKLVDKDHNKKPSKDYEDIFRSEKEFPNGYFDYWATQTPNNIRAVDYKKVNWAKENKE